MRASTASRITIGILSGLALLALWQIFFVQHTLPANASMQPGPESTVEAQPLPLQAEGMRLEHANQPAVIKEQQALLLASQLEADAAVQSKHVSARYVLLTYPMRAGSSAHPNLHSAPVWLIWYQQVVPPASDTSVDQTTASQAPHDLYVFLDANTGSELLAIWV